MLLNILAILVGLALLCWSADKFVNAAADLANYLGMSQLLIGMLIVGCGTSAPELLVSVISAQNGSSGIALGNAYGSNITNITLILGLTACISPVKVVKKILREELVVLLVITLITMLMIGDGVVNRIDAIILLAIFVILVIVGIKKNNKEKINIIENKQNINKKFTKKQAVIWVIIGLILLIASSRILVWAMIEVAREMGISELFIGLTAVALGTSLPELASSIVAAKNKKDEIIIGNIIGSNIFNTLVVVGAAALVKPLNVTSQIINRDYIVMLAAVNALFLFGYSRKKDGVINRIEGAILLAAYIAYTAFLCITEIK